MQIVRQVVAGRAAERVRYQGDVPHPLARYLARLCKRRRSSGGVGSKYGEARGRGR